MKRALLTVAAFGPTIVVAALYGYPALAALHAVMGAVTYLAGPFPRYR